MATAKDGIEYLIEAKVAQAIKNLKKFDKATLTSQKQSTSSFGKIKAGWAAAGAIIGGVVVGGIVNLGKAMVMASAEMETTRISFNTFLGSVEAGGKIMKELQDFSVVTPFTISQINGAAKSLLAFGVEADDIAPTLKLLGDVSAGTGKDLKEMSIIFGKIKGNGRLMGAELGQLIDGGFDPLASIAKKTGKSMVELRKDMAKGLISFDMVKESFKDATSEGGLFFNMMDKQSKTLAGRMSTLEGNVGLLMAALGDELAPAVGVVVDALNVLVKRIDIVKAAIILGLIIPFKSMMLTMRAGVAPLEVMARALVITFSSLAKAGKLLKDGEFKKALKEVGKAAVSTKLATLDTGKSILDQTKGLVESGKKAIKLLKGEEKKAVEEIKKTETKKVEVKKETVTKISDVEKKRIEDLRAFNKETATLAQVAESDKVSAAIEFTKETASIEKARIEKEETDAKAHAEEMKQIAIDGDMLLLESKRETALAIVDATQAMFATINNLSRASSDNAIADLKREMDASIENLESNKALRAIAAEEQAEEIAALELVRDEALASGDERELHNAQRELDKVVLAKRASEEETKIKEAAAAKEKAIKKKQAMADKVFSVFSATLDLGKAISSAFAFTPAGPVVKSAAAGVAAGIAGLNLAAVAATPIPAFAQGGTLETSGPQLFLAGDNASGREKIDITPLDDAGAGAGGGNEFHFHGVQDLESARNELMRTEGAEAFSQG